MMDAAAVVRATLALLALLLAALPPRPAAAATDVASWLLFDARTGEVLARENAFQAWHPASITKLMTTYVVLKAMREGRLRPTSPVTISARANAEPPSKMGFPTGTVLTIDNALKIIMVKSANDVAWAIGESVSGGRDGFIAEMNATATALGMTGTHFVNSNGLPADEQVTTAHDLALLTRALMTEFPQYSGLFAIPALQFGKTRIPNHNDLLERFPGSDGMKTGFICASGYNVVASASRGGRRLVAIVLGARSPRIRSEKAAELMTKGFDGIGMRGFLAPSETIYTMAAGPEADRPVVDLRPVVCGRGPAVAETGEDAQGADAAPAADARATWLSPKAPPGPAVKIWLGGAEMPKPPAGARPAVASATAAPLPAPRPGGATPISRTFDLFGETAATPVGLLPAGVTLSPIIEELPEPPPRKAKPAAASKKAPAATKPAATKPAAGKSTTARAEPEKPVPPKKKATQ